MGLVDGRKKSDDRILLSAKVGTVLVGIAEISLPNGDRFATRVQLKTPKDKAYLSDVAVSPTQRGRGIGKELVNAAERAMANMGDDHVHAHQGGQRGRADSLRKVRIRGTAEVKAKLTQAQIAQRRARTALSRSSASSKLVIFFSPNRSPRRIRRCKRRLLKNRY